jgi:hypothetical protein
MLARDHHLQAALSSSYASLHVSLLLILLHPALTDCLFYCYCLCYCCCCCCCRPSSPRCQCWRGRA